MSAEWMTAPRWTQAHLIVDQKEFRHNDVFYVRTACGRTVRLASLDPEPTGIDTMNRCAVCRRRAESHGADSGLWRADA